MEYIEINGEQVPFRRSLNAMTKFDDKFKTEGVTTFTPTKFGPRHFVYLWYYFIEAGFKFEGETMPYNEEEIGDLITTEDIEKMAKMLEENAEEEKKS